jgi:hypothetical protein
MEGHILELGHRDGRFVRAGGVYVFTRRGPDDRTEALYVGEAAVIAGVAGPGHPVWCRAQQMGLSGLLVVLEADPERRRRFAREMEATLTPVLNGGMPQVRPVAALYPDQGSRVFARE